MAKWRHCALSGEKLITPAMSCELGRLVTQHSLSLACYDLSLHVCRLYNKESVIMALLDKTNLPDLAKHIRSLKVSNKHVFIFVYSTIFTYTIGCSGAPPHSHPRLQAQREG